MVKLVKFAVLLVSGCQIMIIMILMLQLLLNAMWFA